MPVRRKGVSQEQAACSATWLLCKPQPEPGPCVAAGGVPLPPLSPDKIPFSQIQGKPPQQLQTRLPLVPHPLRQRLAVQLHTPAHSPSLCSETQTHLCSDLYLTAGDPCSVTSFSEFVLHGHKLGDRMSLPSLCVSGEPQEGFLIASLQLETQPSSPRSPCERERWGIIPDIHVF